MPGFADAGDKRRIVPAAEPRHLSQRSDPHRGHLSSAVVPRSEIELSYAVSLDGELLQFVKPDSLVFCEKYPPTLAYERKPCGIFNSLGEVAPMALMLHSILGEGVENGFAVVKVFVQIKNEVFRQRRLPYAVPTGSLLRSVLARRHIRRLGRAQIPGR